MQDFIVVGLLLFLFGSAFLIVWVACQEATPPEAPSNGRAMRDLQRHVDREQALAEEFATHPSTSSLYAPGSGDARKGGEHGEE